MLVQPARLTFKLYFPHSPHPAGVTYRSLRSGSSKDGGLVQYNFCGQLLGPCGATMRTIQKESGAYIELGRGSGNLLGAHPDPSDSTLHALISADSAVRLVPVVVKSLHLSPCVKIN